MLGKKQIKIKRLGKLQSPMYLDDILQHFPFRFH